MKKEQKRKRSKEEKGITLIALVITIIILLILAGVTLNAALSENGLFKKAKYAAEEYNKKSIEEQVQLLMAEKELDAASSNGKADITGVLEEMAGEDGISEEEINDFNNKYLQDYGEDEKIIAINDAEEFKKIGTNEENYPLSGTYVQVKDFESLTVTQPIGTRELKEDGTVDKSKDKPFTGIYNGNGCKITNLTIQNGAECTGMFGYNEGTIRNVTINACTVTLSKGPVGAISGFNGGVIENCVIQTGSISNTHASLKDNLVMCVGGICGWNLEGGIIRDCSNKADVMGPWYVAGIAGFNYGNVFDCKNFGNIVGEELVGGICGDSNSPNGKSRISRCGNYGGIKSREDSGKARFGGISGQASGIVEDCVNDGTVNGNSVVGGIVGLINGFNDMATMKFCLNRRKSEWFE